VTIPYAQLYDPATPNVDLSDYRISCTTGGSTINVYDLSGNAPTPIGGLLTFDKSETYGVTEKSLGFDLRVTHAPTQRELSKFLFDSRIANTKPLLTIGTTQSNPAVYPLYGDAGQWLQFRIKPDGVMERQTGSGMFSAQTPVRLDNWWTPNSNTAQNIARSTEVEARAIITQVGYAPVGITNGMLNWVDLTTNRELRLTIQARAGGNGSVVKGYIEFRHKSSGYVYLNKYNFECTVTYAWDHG
jgi:hypothetical protein